MDKIPNNKSQITNKWGNKKLQIQNTKQFLALIFWLLEFICNLVPVICNFLKLHVTRYMLHVTKPQRGFTLTELLISISLLAFVFYISISGFRSFDQANYVRSAQNRVADAIRTAQSLALSGRQIEGNSVTPLAFGVHVEGVTAFVFADRCDKDGLGNWTPTGACIDLNIKIGEDISLTNSGLWPIIIEEIKFGSGTTTDKLDIGFKRMSALGFIDGKQEQKLVDMTFKNTRTNVKKILTYDRISGRVDTEY